MKYEINTSPDTLSIMKNALEDIKISDIPLFKDDDKLLRQYIVTSLLLNISSDEVKFNGLFRAITSSPGVNFYNFTENELNEILISFFENTGDRLISWKRIIESESATQDDLGLMKMFLDNPKLIEKIMEAPTKI